MRIDDLIELLENGFSTEKVESAIAHVAGMPPATHTALLYEIKSKTGRDIASLRGRLSRALKKREPTKFSRLKLRTYLESKGVKGRHENGELVIPDPLIRGDEIIVRDAALLGHKPIVEKSIGYMHPVDECVAALTTEDEINNFLIPKSEIKKAARVLENCDATEELSPRLLATANIQAFKDTFKKGEHQKLLITLQMNQRYSIVESNGQVVVFDNETRNSYTRPEVKAKLESQTDFVKVGKHNMKFSRYKTWFEHPARAYYRSITFAPLNCDVHGRELDLNDAFNLWTGYAQSGVPGDWTLLKEHIEIILCKSDEEAFEYLLDWLAHLFQKPWDKPGVAVVVWGEKRTGKGTVADAIREAMGSNISRMFTQKEHVVGRFAGSAQPLMFNQCEEAVFAKDPREEGPLKSKITDPTETVELKFKTPYEVASFGRWWFNSNSPTPVPITFDEERYFILHVSTERANDHEYFKAIRRQLYHEGGLAAMVYELMNRDIENFNVRKPPHGFERSAMVMEMLSPEDKAVADILIEGEIALLDTTSGTSAFTVPLNREAPTWVDKVQVRSVLNHAFKRYGAKEASAVDITKSLKKLGIIDKDRNAHKRRSQKAGYRFLPLAVARENFAEHRGLTVDMLIGAEQSRSIEEELRDLVGPLARKIVLTELRPAEPPENFHLLQRVKDTLYEFMKSTGSEKTALEVASHINEQKPAHPEEAETVH